MKVLFLLIALFAPFGLSLEPILLQEPAVFPDTHEAFLESVLKTAHFNGSRFVFGGQRAQLGAFPYEAFLSYASRKGGNYICGATILSTTQAVTAAHCAYDMISPAKIMAGVVDLNKPGPTSQVRQIHNKWVNSGYRDGSLQDDIAVLEFNPPLSLNQYVQVVKIPKNDLPVLASGKAIVSGFGTYTFNGDQSVTSPYLLYANVDLVLKATCRQKWGGTPIADSQLCAGSRGRGVGPGDSGGPMQVTHNGQLYQVGIASFVYSDTNIMQHGQDRIPNVFVRASSYCDFIAQSTRGGYQCVDVGGPNPNPDCPSMLISSF